MSVFSIFKNFSLSADNTAPAYDAILTAPSDVVDFPDGICRCIAIGGAGNVTVMMASGRTAIFYNQLAGSYLPVHALRIMATGTTATNMTVMY